MNFLEKSLKSPIFMPGKIAHNKHLYREEDTFRIVIAHLAHQNPTDKLHADVIGNAP